MGRDRTWFHQWRMKQARWLSKQWLKQYDIALVLDVAQPTVSRWLKAGWRDPGRTRGRSARRGRLAKLTAEQMRLIPDFLWHGAEAYGFRGEVWTCRRIGCVLAEEFGLAYSQ